MDFTCPECQKTSQHPDDVVHDYCVNCHRFTDDKDDLDLFIEEQVEKDPEFRAAWERRKGGKRSPGV